VGAITIANYLKSASGATASNKGEGGRGGGGGIERLDLSCNMIGNDGLVALAKVSD
jgi:hypothetical protein